MHSSIRDVAAGNPFLLEFCWPAPKKVSAYGSPSLKNKTTFFRVAEKEREGRES
jgi:hypothetical protein